MDTYMLEDLIEEAEYKLEDLEEANAEMQDEISEELEDLRDTQAMIGEDFAEEM
jgi:predicted  nucleic acid-binding Zn-ribbon protein